MRSGDARGRTLHYGLNTELQAGDATGHPQPLRPYGETGRHRGLKIPRLTACRFKSCYGYHYRTPPQRMKTRRHHNNEGRRQIQQGRTRDQVKAIARRLGIPYKPR